MNREKRPRKINTYLVLQCTGDQFTFAEKRKKQGKQKKNNRVLTD